MLTPDGREFSMVAVPGGVLWAVRPEPVECGNPDCKVVSNVGLSSGLCFSCALAEAEKES